MTVRTKRWDLRMDEDLADWIDEYAVERGVSRTQVVELACKELKALSAGGVPDIEVVRTKPLRTARGVRRCFVCTYKDCICRRFLSPADPEGFIPDCQDGHGPMVRDANRPYFGQPTPV